MFRYGTVYLNVGTGYPHDAHTGIIQGMERINEIPGLERFEVICFDKFPQAFADGIQGLVFEE